MVIDANSRPASPPRRYVEPTHARLRMARIRPRASQHANSAPRSVVSWTTRRTSVTCPSLPTVSLCPRTSAINSLAARHTRQMANLPRHSRSRQVYPYRLACPACWYHFRQQGRRGAFHRYPCRRAGAWCHHQVDRHLPVRPAPGC
jgi:hypothetical protein